MSNLSNKLRILRSELPQEYAAARKADSYYRHNMPPRSQYHLSLTHTYSETLAHAVMAAITGTTDNEKESLAGTMIRAHVLDDLIDRKTRYAEILWHNPEAGLNPDFLPRHFGMNYMVEKGSLRGFQNLCKYSAAGRLIARAKNAKQQEAWCAQFRDYIIGEEPHPVQRSLRKLHPVQLSALAHAGMDCFMEIEGDHDESLPLLYDCLYAPLVYCQNRKEERKREKNRLMIGTEHVKDGMLKDESLLPLVDVYLQHCCSVPDRRKRLRLTQVWFVVEGYEGLIKALLPGLQEKYAEVKARVCEILEGQEPS